MYFMITKPTFTRWRSTPTASLSKLLKSLRKRRCRIAILVPCVLILLLLSKFAFKSRRHAIRQPPPEVDATTEACYDHIRSFSPSSSNHLKRDHEFLRTYGCLVNQGERFLEDGLVNAAGRFGDPPQVFGESAFSRNGWLLRNFHATLPSEWNQVFQGRLRGVSPGEEFPYVQLDQDRRFHNDYHLYVEVSQPFAAVLHLLMEDINTLQLSHTFPYLISGCISCSPRSCERTYKLYPTNLWNCRSACLR